ncbi:MAG TPA: purine-nucleoside phosphorylase [Candidatus Krumholzibacteriaceae bacterium]
MRSSWNASAARAELGAVRGAAAYAIILGSGLAGLADRIGTRVRIPYASVPGLGATSVEGHPGFITLGRIADEPALVFAGRFHRYEGSEANDPSSIVSLAADAGCVRIIVTQAAGSLTRRLRAGTWMLATDALSLPARFAIEPGGVSRREDVRPGARRNREDFSRETRRGGTALVSARLSAEIREAARAAHVPLAEGVLCWTSGPAYETAAEARFAVSLGADAVTMSSLPELIAARRLGLEAASLGWITNHTANISRRRTEHAHVVGMGEGGVRALEAMLTALFRARRTA